MKIKIFRLNKILSSGIPLKKNRCVSISREIISLSGPLHRIIRRAISRFKKYLRLVLLSFRFIYLTEFTIFLYFDSVVGVLLQN